MINLETIGRESTGANQRHRCARRIGYLYLRQGGRLGPVLVGIFAIVFVIEAQARQFGTLQNPGPAMWPTGIGILTVALSVLAAILSPATPALFRPSGTLRVLLYCIAFSIFVLSYPSLGFLLAAALMCFIMLWLAGQVKWFVALPVSAVVSCGVFVIFGLLLELPISALP